MIGETVTSTLLPHGDSASSTFRDQATASKLMLSNSVEFDRDSATTTRTRALVSQASHSAVLASPRSAPTGGAWSLRRRAISRGVGSIARASWVAWTEEGNSRGIG